MPAIDRTTSNSKPDLIENSSSPVKVENIWMNRRLLTASAIRLSSSRYPSYILMMTRLLDRMWFDPILPFSQATNIGIFQVYFKWKKSRILKIPSDELNCRLFSYWNFLSIELLLMVVASLVVELYVRSLLAILRFSM